MGGPQGPIVPTNAPDVQKKDGVESGTKQGQQTATNDGFERGANAAAKKAPDLAAPTGPQMQLKVESEQKFNDMLRQTRNDPKALTSLANTLNLAHGRFAADFTADKAKVASLLDQLSGSKFSGAAVEQTRAEIASLRERMSFTKHRMAIQKRRLRALKQLAGRVSESRLAEEIASIEARMELLDTGWAESFVGLGLGKVIYSPDSEETPEHLKKVVKANVGNTKKNQDAGELGELLSDMHPSRVVTKVAAREIDQDAPKKKLSDEVMQKVRKEKRGGHGRTVQAFAALYELFESDPEEPK